MAATKQQGRASKLRAPATAAPVARVEVKIDRALKRRWDETSAALRAADREGASAFDRKWEAVATIVEHDPPLFLAGGIATLKEFLAQHVGETDRNARRLMRVAKYASPVEEERFGPTKPRPGHVTYAATVSTRSASTPPSA